jgi:hypothetical protein
MNEAWAGQINTEQAVQIIEAVGNAKAQVAEATAPVMKSEPNMDFSYLLLLAVIPVLLGYWLNKKRKK